MNLTNTDQEFNMICVTLMDNHILGLAMIVDRGRYDVLHKIPYSELIKIFDAPILSEHIPTICANDPAISQVISVEIMKRVQSLFKEIERGGSLDLFTSYSSCNGWLGIMVLKYITENAMSQTLLFGISELDCLVLGLVKRITLDDNAMKYLTVDMMQYIIKLLNEVR